MSTDSTVVRDAWRSFYAAAQPALDDWQAAVAEPSVTQAKRLRDLLAANRDTAFGRAYGFATISDAAQYRERVPLHTYADLLPWIERAQRETAAVLSAQPPRFFERTSGNSALQKLIPYTPAFLGEMQRALVVWLADVYRQVPGIALGRAYWSMSPPLQANGHAANGIPIGSASDLDYLGGSIVAGLAPTLIVPSFQDDVAEWRKQTLLTLIAADDLSFISVWSPTFLSSLLRPLFEADDPGHAATLGWLDARLPIPRNAALRAALAEGTCEPLWPRLAAVSCWMDGPSRQYATQLRARFPQVRWLPKGLFATEAVITLPFGSGEGCALAIESHFLEFMFDDGRVCEAAELQRGDIAQVVVTTGGGLYRYLLGDRVQVVGFTGRTPRVEFVGRTGAQCDLVGEKLDETTVASVLKEIFTDPGEAVCLAPCATAEPPHYVLLIASSTPRAANAVATEVESALLRAFHYAHARRLGQLGPVQVRHLTGSPQRLAGALQRAAEQTGIRAGDAKPRMLIGRLDTANALLALTGN
ncbi:GH3 family domain-containing protein [Paraburkholderia agricolaris]|uniref:GH3 family domain-containing protein n=1 Tax=Paraburkholderia agricolaris TaxID=2152888 RepID=UPI001290A1D9|nr:GH3 auxin-responsive promoter family protein [Paraburkholderia agricolaris]